MDYDDLIANMPVLLRYTIDVLAVIGTVVISAAAIRKILDWVGL